MSDYLENNGPGIDTKRERDLINYRPEIKYTLPRIISTDNMISVSEAPIAVQKVAKPTLNSLWNDCMDVSQGLNDLKAKLEEKLVDTYAEVPASAADSINNAANNLGYSLTDNRIPFSMYKEVLGLDDSPGKLAITNLFEQYHADVNGDIRAELYPEVLNMQQDWSDMIDFIKKGLFTQVVSMDKLPSTLSKTDPALVNLADEEQIMGDAYVTAKVADYQALKSLKAAYGVADSDTYYALKAVQAQTDKAVKDLQRRIHTKAETVSVVKPKVYDTRSMVELLNRLVDYRAYKGDLQDILVNLLNQYSSGQSMLKGLRSIQALIKLNVDNKVTDYTAMQSSAKTISNRNNKLRASQSLTNAIHLRNTVYHDVHYVMDQFDGAPSLPSFDMFAEHIVDGVGHADKLYTDQSSNFYKTHALDSELRRGKINKLVDKDSAREIYKIIDKMISYASGKGWPSNKDVASWVKDFINYEKLD